MFKKLFIVLVIIYMGLGVGCGKDEVVLDEDGPHIIADKEKPSAVIDEGSKPLIPVSPTDTLKILVREDGAPGMYRGKDGEVHGFYVDLEKMVMKEMGQSYTFVPYNDVGPVVHGMKTGTYHIALAVPDMPEYRTFVNLSIPYEVLHYLVFVRKDNTDISGSSKEALIHSLHGKKVGVQSQGHIYQILRGIKEIEVLEYPTTTRALKDLAMGALDAVPDVKRIGLYYTAKNNWDIMPVGVPILSQKLTTGISSAFDPSLVDRYNKALKALISDGRFDTLYEGYFGPMNPEDRPF